MPLDDLLKSVGILTSPEQEPAPNLGGLLKEYTVRNPVPTSQQSWLQATLGTFVGSWIHNSKQVIRRIQHVDPSGQVFGEPLSHSETISNFVDYLSELEDQHPEWRPQLTGELKDLVSDPKQLAALVSDAVAFSSQAILAGLAGAALGSLAGPKGAVVGGLAGSFLWSYAVEGQEAYDEAKRNGATDAEAELAANLTGAISGGIELLQVKGVVRIGKQFRRAFQSKATREAEAFMRRAGIRSPSRELAQAIAWQGIQEALQGSTGEGVARIIYGKPIEDGFIARRVFEATAGSIAGGFLGGSQAAILEAFRGNLQALENAKRTDASDRPIYSRDRFRALLEKQKNLTPKLREGLMAVVDAHASTWAQATGNNASDWYEQKLSFDIDHPEVGEILTQTPEAVDGFYSKLENVVYGLEAKSLTGSQILAELRRQGVKDEEIRWTLGTTLEEQADRSISLEELGEAVTRKRLRFRTVIYKEDFSEKDGMESHQLLLRSFKLRDNLEDIIKTIRARTTGLDNADHTEVLAAGTEEERQKYLELKEEKDRVDAAGDKLYGWSQYGPRRYPSQTSRGEFSNYREVVLALPSDPLIYEERTHFSIPNNLVHLRLTDRKGTRGEKVLFVEEIQSDWAQRGRIEGYVGEEEELKQTTIEIPQGVGDDLTADQIFEKMKGSKTVREGKKPNELIHSPESYEELWRAEVAYYKVRAEFDRWVKENLPEDYPIGSSYNIELLIQKLEESGFSSDILSSLRDIAARYKQVSTALAEVRSKVPTVGERRAQDLPLKATGDIPLSAIFQGFKMKVKNDRKIYTFFYKEVKAGAETSVEPARYFTVPVSPIANSWQELAIKKAIQLAVEGDYDGVGFVNDRQIKLRNDTKKETQYLNVIPRKVQSVLKQLGVDSAAHAVQIPGVGIHNEDVAWENTKKTIYENGSPEDIKSLETISEGLAALGKVYEDLIWTYGTENVQIAFVNHSSEAPLEEQAYIPITPELSSKVLEGLPLYQGPKGSVQFLKNGRAIIRLFEEADVSTVLHELAHIFRRDLAQISPEDLGILEKFYGVKNGIWSVEHEEKVARGYERYIREGHAPSQGLVRVFELFSTWLKKIYTAIRGSKIDVKLSPEVRGVFDRFLVRDNPEIAAKRQEIVDLSAQLKQLGPEFSLAQLKPEPAQQEPLSPKALREAKKELKSILVSLKSGDTLHAIEPKSRKYITLYNKLNSEKATQDDLLQTLQYVLTKLKAKKSVASFVKDEVSRLETLLAQIQPKKPTVSVTEIALPSDRTKLESLPKTFEEQTIFEGGAHDPNLPFAWRSMSEKELRSLLAGGVIGGPKPSRGGYFANSPGQASLYRGSKKYPRFLVEFEGVQVGPERTNRPVKSSDIRGVWKFDYSTQTWERITSLLQIEEGKPKAAAVPKEARAVSKAEAEEFVKPQVPKTEHAKLRDAIAKAEDELRYLQETNEIPTFDSSHPRFEDRVNVRNLEAEPPPIRGYRRLFMNATRWETVVDLAAPFKHLKEGRDNLERLARAEQYTRSLTGQFENDIATAYNNLGREDFEWLRTVQPGQEFSNWRRMIDYQGTPKHLRITNPPSGTLAAYRDLIWEINDSLADEAIEAGVLRRRPRGVVEPFRRSANPSLARAPLDYTWKLFADKSGEDYEALVDAIIKYNPKLQRFTRAKAARIIRRSLDSWFAKQSVREVGSLEEVRHIQYMPDHIRVRGKLKAIFHIDPYYAATRAVDLQARRIALIRIFGQSNIFSKRAGESLQSLAAKLAKALGVSPNKREVTIQHLIEDGVEEEVVRGLNNKALIEFAKLRKVAIGPTLLDYADALDRVSPFRLKSDQERLIRRIASMRGVVVNETGGSDTPIPRSIVDVYNDLRLHLREDHTDILQLLEHRYVAEGGKSEDFQRVFRVWQGLPYGMRKRTLTYRVAGFLSNVIGAAQTSLSVAPNLTQTLALVPKFVGWTRYAQAVANTLADPKMTRAQIAALGAMSRNVYVWSIEPGYGIESVGRNIRQFVGKITGLRYVNERNQVLAGEAFRILAEDWQAHGLEAGDYSVAKALELSEKEIQEIKDQNMSDATKAKIVQQGVAKTQFSTEARHRKGLYENVPILRMLFSYFNYTAGASRALIAEGESLVADMKSKDRARMHAAGMRLVRFILGSATAGLFGGEIIRQLLKGQPPDIEDEDSLVDLGLRGLLEMQFFGATHRILDPLAHDNGIFERALIGLMPQVSAASQLLGSVLNYGRYEDFPIEKRVFEAAKGNFPLGKSLLGWFDGQAYPEQFDYFLARKATAKFIDAEIEAGRRKESRHSGIVALNPLYQPIYEAIYKGDMESAKELVEDYYSDIVQTSQDPRRDVAGLRASLLARAPIGVRAELIPRFLKSVPEEKRQAIINADRRYRSRVDTLVPNLGESHESPRRLLDLPKLTPLRPRARR